MTPNASLAAIAALARQLAPLQCPDGGNDAATSCCWYHAAWPTLRLIGTVSGIDGDIEFFRSAFSQNACDGDRVLITAAADHAMLEHVVDAYRSTGAEPDVTVVDRCRTPLALNRYFGEHAGARLECLQDDIVTHRPDMPFDVVCTHSILSFVPEGERDALFANWRAMLRPGGRLVFSQAVRPGHGGGPDLRRFSSDEVEAFVARALADAAGAAGPAGEGCGHELAGLARRFATNKTAFVVDSAERIGDGLRQAGFEVARMEARPRGSNYASASPETPSAIVNARFVAVAR